VSASLKVRDVLRTDPTTAKLLNDGVADVRSLASDEELRMLRYELETFVCDGEYEKGLYKILDTYLKHIGDPKQPAAWVSGFYGSGKSHLVKMLRALWIDVRFDDGVTARGLAKLPEDVRAKLHELSVASKKYGGLRAAGGTLGSGAGDSVRLALLGIVFGALKLPTAYPVARFVLWLRSEGVHDAVRGHVEAKGKNWEHELQHLHVSPVLADALLQSLPGLARNSAEARQLLKTQFPNVQDISIDEMTKAIEDAFSIDGKFPLALLVLDEVQQYIGDASGRTYAVQEVVEACSSKFKGKLLFVATGQSALTATPQLEKLKGRFTVSVQLSDADVERVIREVVLSKRADRMSDVTGVLTNYAGEISSHLKGSKLAPIPEDRDVAAADYPLLPTRRRFWEQVLRAVDQAGTAGQLRTQLKIVHEAARQVAERPLGTVVAGDFVYGQLAPSLLQTGALLKEVHELIEKQRTESDDGELRARIASLVFFIGKLSREAGSEIGVKADATTIADLLVEDLPAGSAQLRKRVKDLLADMATKHVLQAVGDEFRLQTRESSEWNAEFAKKLQEFLNDPAKSGVARDELLRQRAGEALKSIKLVQGKTKTPRKLAVHFGKQPPVVNGEEVPVWVRDGWQDEEASVIADARIAGTSSPIVTVFLPRKNAEELKKALAEHHAARSTLDVRGYPSTREGQEARSAMDTRVKFADQRVSLLLDEILEGARVFVGGGQEYGRLTVQDGVKDAAEAALARLYPHFDDGDDARWEKVMQQVKGGVGNPLDAVGHADEPQKQPVVAAILTATQGSQKGSDVRARFCGKDYGWPRETVDGALMALVAANLAIASYQGKAVSAKELNHANIGPAVFRAEVAVLTANQRLALKKLFQDAGITTKANEESIAAARFLDDLRDLASRAGNDPPAPARPGTAHIEHLLSLAGNAQLSAIYEARERLASDRTAWAKAAELIAQRLPRWRELERLVAHARATAATPGVQEEMRGIENGRRLLDTPDPIPPLRQTISAALRSELQRLCGELEATHTAGMSDLSGDAAWIALGPAQRDALITRYQLAPLGKPSVGTDSELLDTLDKRSLNTLVDLRDALPSRFAQARAAAAKLAEPEVRTVKLKSATLRNAADLQAWLEGARAQIESELAHGPVLL
jgi:hypothetical protein